MSLVTTARSIKKTLQQIGADKLVSIGQEFYHSVLLKDTGNNYIRKTLNGDVYRMVPSLAVFTDVYELHVAKWLKENLQAGDTYWDVGANYGMTVLQAARIVKENGEVLAIEPSPANLEILKRNIHLNGYDSVIQPIDAAVCDRDGGTITFSLIDNGLSPCNSLMFSNATNSEIPQVSQEISVPTISLDGLMSKNKRLPKLVKIDVEGAELKVLKGAIQLLSSQSAPMLILAIHPFWLETPEDCQEILSLLKGWGYQIYNREGASVENLEYDEYLCLPNK
jgi:FkbM family methyltransferase